MPCLIPEHRRRQVFSRLLELQDAGHLPVPRTRALVKQEFHLTDEELKCVEDEGVMGDWVTPVG